MKHLLCIMLLMCALLISGCAATTIVMDNNHHRKIITRCDNDIFCFRNTYDVAWDFSGQTGCSKHITECGSRNNFNSNVYPVSYRSSEFVYANDPIGYVVTLPAGGNVAKDKNKYKEATVE